MADINLGEAIARARAKAARENNLATTQGVPAEAERYNRFVLGEQERMKKAAQERPLDNLDKALAIILGNPLPSGMRMNRAMIEGATMGAIPVARAGIDALTQDNRNFFDALQQRQAESRLAKAYSPGMATAAEMTTAGMTGNVAARGLQAGLASMAPNFAASPVGNAVVQGVTGAAQSAAQSAATGEGDPTTAALLGGGLSAAAGFALPLTGAAATDAAKRQAAENLFGREMNDMLGRVDRPLDLFDVLARRRELGPSATIADLDPLLAASAKGALNPKTADAAAQLLANTKSATRPVADIMMDDIDAAIGPSYGKVARAEDRAAILGQASNDYNTALADMRANGFEVDAPDLRSTIESAFTRNGVTTSSFKDARDRMLRELDGITGYRAPKYNKKGELVDAGDPGKSALTVDEALALKKEFDMMISTADPAKSVPREVRAVVIDTKNALNEQLKADPKFAAAAKIYADEADVQNAEKFALEVFKGNYSASDFAKMFDKMSDVEKQAVARAARDEIQTRVLERPNGAMALSRRVGPTQDAAFTDKLDKVFGPKAVDKLYEASMRARAFSTTAKMADDAAAATIEANARGVGTTGKIGNVADVLTVLQQAAQGRATSGATAGAVRRLFVEGKKASQRDVQREMLSYLGKQGTDADTAMAEIMSFLYGTAPPRLATGAGAGIGSTAAAGYGALKGPQ